MKCPNPCSGILKVKTTYRGSKTYRCPKCYKVYYG